MTSGAAYRTPAWVWAALAIAAATLFAGRVSQQLAARAAAASPIIADLDGVILFYGILPRAAVALLAGATAALSGLLLQRILRNPLAEPSTLGVSAGAQLALATATLHAPWLMQGAREAVALAGGLAAVCLVLALTWRRGLEPVSVVLAGMMVALTATAASAALILANGEYMFSLFIWGGGSLVQQSWGPAATLAIRLALGFAAALFLLRPLAILGLEDASAKSLGVALHSTRLLVVGIAVWLASTVTSEVGVIGFVGLAAPALATLSGARSMRQKLVAAPLIGAILLWLTDGVVQLAAAQGGERIPAGAATALLGGPLLLWMLPRLKLLEWPSLATRSTVGVRAGRPWALVAGCLGVLLFALLAALALGRGIDGWSLATGALFSDLFQWRAPRIAVAAASGAMLAAAGLIIQRVTANPIASPEVLGVGSGAGVGMTVVLFSVSAPSLGLQLAGLAIGAVATLAIMLAISARNAFGPERLLLAGIAMSALGSAVITAVIASGNIQAFALLRWLSGSTNQAAPLHAVAAVLALAVLLVPTLLALRWLALLPLGDGIARSLGVPVRRARLVLVVVAGLLTAMASLFVGPPQLAGLVAPHLSRLIGLTRVGPCLAGSVVLGAILLVASDWLSRMVAFPYELPVGLFHRADQRPLSHLPAWKRSEPPWLTIRCTRRSGPPPVSRCANPEAIVQRLCEHFAEHGSVTRSQGVAVFDAGFGATRIEVDGGNLAIDAEGADETSLAYVKMSVAEHILAFARPEAPTIVWQGDVMAGLPLPYFREMRVTRIANVTPHMRRVTLAGTDLARFAVNGLHVRLLFRRRAAPRQPGQSWGGRPPGLARRRGPPCGARLHHSRHRCGQRRDRRRFRPARRQRHAGARFAAQAGIGDVVGMTGPGGGSVGAADWYLLAGDETALAAIGRILETLPGHARAVVRIEIADESEIQPLRSPAQTDIEWLPRNGAEAGTTSLLEDAVKAVLWPAVRGQDFSPGRDANTAPSRRSAHIFAMIRVLRAKSTSSSPTGDAASKAIPHADKGRRWVPPPARPEHG